MFSRVGSLLSRRVIVPSAASPLAFQQVRTAGQKPFVRVVKILIVLLSRPICEAEYVVKSNAMFPSSHSM